MELINDMKRTPKKYLTLLGGSLVMFTMGSENTLGTMSPYFMSYLREYNGIKSVRYSQTIWLYTVNKVVEILNKNVYFALLKAFFADIHFNFSYISRSFTETVSIHQ